MQISIKPIPTPDARALQAGGPDAHGYPAERHTSDGSGIPCRHCLEDVAVGEDYLILAYSPFASAQPYAETGPIFLHQKTCQAYSEQTHLPPEILRRELVLMKAYGSNHRIVYGKGCLISPVDILNRAVQLLSEAGIAYLHVRSAYNNCYSFRVDRG